MSKPIKAKKVRKPMSPQAKRNLANIFGSLISNQRAIDGAKELPIWVAIIFFLISAFLPVIPTMVANANSYGSSFVANTTYNLDRTLPELSKTISSEGKIFKVVDKKLVYENKPDVPQTTPVAVHTNSATGEYDLKIYYSNGDLNAAKEVEGSLNNLWDYLTTKEVYKKGTTQLAADDEENKYTPSFVILHEQRLYVCIYQASSTKAVASTYGGSNWDNYTSELNLFERVTTLKKPTTYEVEIDKQIFDNWKEVFNEAYLTQKGTSFLISTFVFLGIFAGLIIFMGLMIFLLTRGKKNVFRCLSFLTCEKIAAWASFSPALLGLVLGFIFANQSTLFFIMMVGIRIMWLSMKQLRPQY